MTENFQTLKNLIAQNFGIEVGAISLSSKLKEDLGADSLDALHLIVAVNEYYKINLDSEKIGKIETVSQLLDLIEKEV